MHQRGLKLRVTPSTSYRRAPLRNLPTSTSYNITPTCLRLSSRCILPVCFLSPSLPYSNTLRIDPANKHENLAVSYDHSAGPLDLIIRFLPIHANPCLATSQAPEDLINSSSAADCLCSKGSERSLGLLVYCQVGVFAYKIHI